MSGLNLKGGKKPTADKKEELENEEKELEEKFLTMRKFYKTHIIVIKKLIEHKENVTIFEAEDRLMEQNIKLYVYNSVWKDFNYEKIIESINKMIEQQKVWQIQLWTLSISKQKYALDIPPMDFTK